MCRLSWNMGASSSWNPQGLSWPVQGLFFPCLHDTVFPSDFPSRTPCVLFSIRAICTVHLNFFDFSSHAPVHPQQFTEAVNDWGGIYQNKTNHKANRGTYPKVDSNQLLQPWTAQPLYTQCITEHNPLCYKHNIVKRINHQSKQNTFSFTGFAYMMRIKSVPLQALIQDTQQV